MSGAIRRQIERMASLKISKRGEVGVRANWLKPERKHVPKVADDAMLDRFERERGVKLPEQYREMLAVSNGMSLLGVTIFDLDAGAWHPEQRLLAFSDWGTFRDVDCIALDNSPYPFGSVVFVNGDPSRSVVYQNSLLDWLVAFEREVIATKDRGLPYWYKKHKTKSPMAEPVLEAAHRGGWDLAPASAEAARAAYREGGPRWYGGRWMTSTEYDP